MFGFIGLSKIILYIILKHASGLFLKIVRPFLVASTIFHVACHLLMYTVTFTPIEKIKLFEKKESEKNRKVRYFGEVYPRKGEISFLQSILVSLAPSYISFWLFIYLLNVLIRTQVNVLTFIFIFFLMILLVLSAVPSFSDLEIIPEAFRNDIHNSLYQILMIVLSILATWYIVSIYNLQFSHEILVYMIISAFYFLFKFGFKITGYLLSSNNAERHGGPHPHEIRSKKFTRPKYEPPIKPKKNPVKAKKSLFKKKLKTLKKDKSITEIEVGKTEKHDKKSEFKNKTLNKVSTNEKVEKLLDEESWINTILSKKNIDIKIPHFREKIIEYIKKLNSQIDYTTVQKELIWSKAIEILDEFISRAENNISNSNNKEVKSFSIKKKNIVLNHLNSSKNRDLILIHNFFLIYYNLVRKPANFGTKITKNFEKWVKLNSIYTHSYKEYILKKIREINEEQEILTLVINIIKNSNYSLSQISNLLKSIGLFISYTSIGKIALIKVYKKNFKQYRERFPNKNTPISEKKRKRIIVELQKENPKSLRAIARKFLVSQKTITDIALEVYKDNLALYHKRWPSTSNYISRQKRELIIQEIKKENPLPLCQIADLHSVALVTVYRMAIHIYHDKMSIFHKKFTKAHISNSVRDQIHYDIGNTSLNIREIARKNNISHSTIWFLALKFFKNNRKAYKTRFPKADYLDIGNETHNCINFLLTDFFDKILNEIYYSEPRYLRDSNKGPDGLIMKNLFQKALSINNNSDKLVNEIGLDMRTIANIDAVIFDFTNDVSEENIKKKIYKYQNKSLLLFIVGIRWHKSWDTSIKDIPYNDNIVLRKNCFVISYELFEDLIGLTKEFKDKFEKIVKFNLLRDLNSLIDLHEELRCDLHKSDELIKEFEKL